MPELNALWDDNSSWFEDKSVTKANAIVTIGTIMLRRVPKRARHGGGGGGGEELERDPENIRSAMEKAEAFVQASGSGTSGPRVKHPDFREYR